MAAAKLQVGDRVSFVDEVGGGVVLRNGRPGHVVVRTDDGFELERTLRGLVRVVERGVPVWRIAVGRGPRSLGGLGLAGALAGSLGLGGGLAGGADALEEDAGGLVGGVLGDELAAEGLGEDGLGEGSQS